MSALAIPAGMSFKMVWKPNGQPVKFEDPSKHFRFVRSRATVQMEAEIHVPSIGFSWKSDPLETSKCDFAVLGEKVNGRYYDS